MGYRIYWRRPAEIEKPIFLAILDDFRRLLAPLHEANVRLAGGDGKGEPVLHENGVWMNGAARCGHDRRHVPDVKAEMLRLTRGGNPEAIQELLNSDWVPLSCPGSCKDGAFNFPRLLWNPAWPDDEGWESLDTHRSYYDLALTSFLIVAKHHMGDDLHLWDSACFWFDARELCERHLGYGRDLQLFASVQEERTPRQMLNDMVSKLTQIATDHHEPALHHQPWDEAQEKKLVEAYRAGGKLTQVAHSVGRSVQSIKLRLVQLGEFSPDGFDPRSKYETIHKTMSLFREGKTLREIGRERNLTYSTVGGHLASAIWMGEEVALERVIGHADVVAISEALDIIGPASIQRLSHALRGQYDYTLLKIGWAACRPRNGGSQRGEAAKVEPAPANVQEVVAV